MNLTLTDELKEALGLYIFDDKSIVIITDYYNDFYIYDPSSGNDYFVCLIGKEINLTIDECWASMSGTGSHDILSGENIDMALDAFNQLFK